MSRLWPVVAVLVAAFAAGCEDGAAPAVRLIVTSDLEAPTELDGVKVTVIGSRSATEDLLCEPVERTFGSPSGGGSLRLPVEVLVERGSVYVAWIAFHVEGRLDGGTVVWREQVVSWPEEGVLDVEIVLERACLDATCTPTIEQCIRGTCHGVQRREIFADPTLRDLGMSCMEE